MNSDLSALDHDAFIEAAAGTGKTAQVVKRTVRILASGRANIDQIALVTFSNKAAGELLIRLRTALEAELGATKNEEQERLREAISSIELALIDTIHGLCGRILRSHPIEAGLDPEFRLVGDEAKPRLETELRRWLSSQLGQVSVHPTLARYLARIRSSNRKSSPIGELAWIMGRVVDSRDLDAAWPKPDLNLRKGIEEGLFEVQQLASTLEEGERGDPLRVELAPVTDLAAWANEADIDTLDPVGMAEAEARLAELAVTLKQLGRRGLAASGQFSEGRSSFSVRKQAMDLQSSLESFISAADQVLAADLFKLLSALARDHAQKSRALGLIDFQDLLLSTRELLAKHPSVLGIWQSKLRYLMVDEFQDTDSLQIEIIEQLCPPDGSGPKLTLVGDPKQSIYGFRRVDLNAFVEAKTRFRTRGAQIFELTRSYRSTAPIQAFINQCFEAPMMSSLGSYVALEGGPEPVETQASVIALPTRHPFNEMGHVRSECIRASLADDIPALVQWLLESGWKVRAANGDLRCVKPSDICLIFREHESFGELRTAPFQQGFEQRGIKHVSIGSSSLRDRDEVEAIITALYVLEWPADELSLWACLRGQLFAFSDRDLLSFRERHGALHLYRSYEVSEPTEIAIAASMEALRELSRFRNRRPYAETLDRLLGPELTRAEVGFRLLPDGERALGNIARIREALRAAEQVQLSFRGSLEALRELADQARLVDRGTQRFLHDGVRLMTAHAVKGLEFPVVILADPTVSLRTPTQLLSTKARKAVFKLGSLRPLDLAQNEEQLAEAEEAETLRLAYVAATRARDLLVIPTLARDSHRICGKRRSWLAPLLAGLEPKPSDLREAFEPIGPLRGGKEGLYLRDQQSIVWWDSETLPPKPPPRFGIAYEDYLTNHGEHSTQRYERWHAYFKEAIDIASEQSVLLTSLELAEEAGIVSVRSIPFQEMQPHQRRRVGHLFHRSLRHIDLLSSETVLDLVRVQGRELSAPSAEVSLVEKMLDRVRADEVVQRARRAKSEGRRVWHDLPVVFTTRDGAVAEPLIDLAFEEADGWVLVNFSAGDRSREALSAKMQHALAGFEAAGESAKIAVVLLFEPA